MLGRHTILICLLLLLQEHLHRVSGGDLHAGSATEHLQAHRGAHLLHTHSRDSHHHADSAEHDISAHTGADHPKAHGGQRHLHAHGEGDHQHSHGGWDCVHSKVKELETIPAKQRYGNRRAGHSPIRIYFEVSQLDADLNGDVPKIIYVNKVLEGARQRLQEVINVVPVDGNLFVARKCNTYWSNGARAGECAEETRNNCGTQSLIPGQHLDELTVFYSDNDFRTFDAGGGIPNTDLVLYVTAQDEDGVCSDNQALAYADSCQRDQWDRPIAGFINFCAERLDSERDTASMDDIILAIHEIVHVLGMSASSYPFFRDPEGNPRTARCPEAADSLGGVCSFRSQLENAPPKDQDGVFMVDSSVVQVEFAEDGTSLSRVVTPTVRSVTQEHFACSTVQGAELEDDGGIGTRTSHWEKRVFFTEFMTGSRQSASDSVISTITLALLQDTGWYEVDFSGADQLKWGRQQGCSFLDQCPAWNCSLATEDDQQTCTFDRSGVGYCGEDPLMDECSIVLPYTNQRCSSIDHESQARCGDQDCVGSYFGEGGACMSTTLVLAGFQLPGDSVRVSCYQHRCTVKDGEDVLEVQTPDGEWQVCDETNKALRTKGYDGAIICPATSELCGDFALSTVDELIVPSDDTGGWPVWATYLCFGVGVLLAIGLVVWCINRFYPQYVWEYETEPEEHEGEDPQTNQYSVDADVVFEMSPTSAQTPVPDPNMPGFFRQHSSGRPSGSLPAGVVRVPSSARGSHHSDSFRVPQLIQADSFKGPPGMHSRVSSGEGVAGQPSFRGMPGMVRHISGQSMAESFRGSPGAMYPQMSFRSPPPLAHMSSDQGVMADQLEGVPRMGSGLMQESFRGLPPQAVVPIGQAQAMMMQASMRQMPVTDAYGQIQPRAHPQDSFRTAIPQGGFSALPSDGVRSQPSFRVPPEALSQPTFGQASPSYRQMAVQNEYRQA